jgi:hypothetical protein
VSCASVSDHETCHCDKYEPPEEPKRRATSSEYAPRTPGKQPICINWNRHTCTSTRCQYQHVCWECHQGHKDPCRAGSRRRGREGRGDRGAALSEEGPIGPTHLFTPDSSIGKPDQGLSHSPHTSQQNDSDMRHLVFTRDPANGSFVIEDITRHQPPPFRNAPQRLTLPYSCSTIQTFQ